MRKITYKLPNPEQFFPKYERKIKSLIRGYVQDISDFVKANNASEYATYQFIDSYFFTKSKTVDLVSSIYTETGLYYARHAFNTINKAMNRKNDFEFFLQVVFERLKNEGLSLWAGIDETIKENIKAIIFEAFTEGLSPLEVADKIVRLSDKFVKKEALIIARTEIISAANKGALEGALRTNFVQYKEWVSGRDSRTRPAHKRAHGQRVGIKEPFIVDGEQLMHPGDRAGSAKNIVRCRCVMLFFTE